MKEHFQVISEVKKLILNNIPNNDLDSSPQKVKGITIYIKSFNKN